MEWTRKYCVEGFDKNPIETQKSREEKNNDWEFSVKATCIIKDLMNGQQNLPPGREEEMLGHNAIAGGFQGQRQWTDYYPNTDFAEAIMNSSFDWNGAREPYILATENDTLNAASMLFGKLLTHRAQLFADVRTYWSPEAVAKAADGYQVEGKALESGGFIHLINSGSACLDASGAVKNIKGEAVIKEWWEMSEQDQKSCLEATTWNPGDLGYFRGSGYSSRFLTKSEMPCTMMRINIIKGLGPVMQLAEGWTVSLPDEVSDRLWKRTDYTWPCTWFSPRTTGKGAFSSAYDVMNNWGANHGAISYGHIGADIISLCSILRIPVCMHNVPEEKIFRPAVWNSFGMDKEGADYRACSVYGPMYK
jgi:L-fucose isomerase